MARVKRDGLLYFPLDCNFFFSKNIRILRSRYGNDGVAVYLYVLCEVYRGKGYYVEKNEEFVDLMADCLHISFDKTEQILAFLFKRSILTLIYVDEAGILLNADAAITAKSIQLQYQESTSDNKRDYFVYEDLWILEKEETASHIKFVKNKINPGKIAINPGKIAINPGNMQQIKTNKIKENKNKHNGTPSASASGSAGERAFDYRRYTDYWNSHCGSLPKVRGLSDTRKKYIRKRVEEHGPDQVIHVIDTVMRSDFLTGKNGSWNATFDWVMRPNNFLKILEGNYENKTNDRVVTTDYYAGGTSI